MASEPVILVGKRVTLRPPKLADFDEVEALMQRSARLFRGLVNPLQGKAEFADYVESSSDEECFRFLICRTEDGVILGSISLFLIERRTLENACVGYMVGEPHTRQGYGTEALRLVLRFAFRELNLHRVEANIQPQNAASIALVKRVGFGMEGYSPRFLKICGKWRDHERWAILVEDWRKLREK
jgi:[ribosomal protein S5]-alanine N-acetyltransferase